MQVLLWAISVSFCGQYFASVGRDGSRSHRWYRGAAAKNRWVAEEGQEGEVRRGLGPAGVLGTEGSDAKALGFVRGIDGAIETRHGGRCSLSCGLGLAI